MNSVNQEELGRGINVVVIDPQSKSVIKFQNFDTYAFSKNEFHFFVIVLGSMHVFALLL